MQRFDSRLPLIFPDSMSAIVDGHLARPRCYLLLLALFVGLAVLLEAVGIYGVVACVIPAGRASRVPPGEALRGE